MVLSWLFGSPESDTGQDSESSSEQEPDATDSGLEDGESQDSENTEDVFLGTSSDDSTESVDETPEHEPGETAAGGDNRYMNQSENGEEDVQQQQSQPKDPRRDGGEEPVTEEEQGNPENGTTAEESRDPVRTPEQQSSNGRYRVASEDAYMELPDRSITTTEKPDPDASVEKLLPETLPGWQLQKMDQYRWIVESAEEFITATYRDPLGDRYMVHVSRWQPEHVQYVVNELYCMGKPTDFDAWTARGRYVFAVKIDRGTVEQAKKLLATAPPLSMDYLEQ